MESLAHKTLYPKPNIRATALWQNKTIGILGGSFNPVHQGHLHISKQALASLPIDALWWSFTPGNPFKKHIKVDPVQQRIAKAETMISDPRIILTDIESQLGINRTHELCKALAHYFPKTKFIWIGGMDLPEEIHKWENWRSVLDSMPIVFFKRPPFKGTLKRIPLRILKSVKHIYSLPKHSGDYHENHVYWALQGPTRKISSSEIRSGKIKAEKLSS